MHVRVCATAGPPVTSSRMKKIALLWESIVAHAIMRLTRAELYCACMVSRRAQARGNPPPQTPPPQQPGPATHLPSSPPSPSPPPASCGVRPRHFRVTVWTKLKLLHNFVTVRQRGYESASSSDLTSRCPDLWRDRARACEMERGCPNSACPLTNSVFRNPRDWRSRSVAQEAINVNGTPLVDTAAGTVAGAEGTE